MGHLIREEYILDYNQKLKSKTKTAFILGVIVTYLICVYVIHATI